LACTSSPLLLRLLPRPPGLAAPGLGTVAAASSAVMASQMSSARCPPPSTPLPDAGRRLVLLLPDQVQQEAAYSGLLLPDLVVGRPGGPSRALDVGLAGLAMALMVSNCLVAVLILLVKAASCPQGGRVVGAMLMITRRTTLALSL
jgi:hypothetical protein